MHQNRKPYRQRDWQAPGVHQHDQGYFFCWIKLFTNGPGSNRSQAPFVGNGPGAIALKRMPYFDHSTANERVMANTPPLAVADGTT